MPLCLPPGLNLSENEVLKVIDKIAVVLSKKHVIPGYEREDIMQEIRLMAMDGLKRFRPEAGQLENYLMSHCRRRALNMRRDKFRRADPPCRACHVCEQEGRPVEHHADNRFCPSYVAWKDRNDKKATLATNMPLNAFDERYTANEDPEEEIETAEILSLIDRKLPAWLRGPYLRMKEGVAVAKPLRVEVVKAIQEILSKAGVELDLSVIALGV